MKSRGLLVFLCNVEGSIERIADHNTYVHQDMESPLSHYFIYTEHNSYLSGNQLYSECSDIPIMKALEKGMRAIELDLWPNAEKDDAEVLHGRFTQKNLLRIYPEATRFTSSNYNPLLGWIRGTQMAALNMQGYGRSLWLMHGMFRANGGCRYVKKPEFLLKTGPNDEVFDPKSATPIKKTLKVRVYMGDGWRFDFRQTYFDKYSPPDFYTRVGIAGVPADTVMKRTKAIEDNWTPMWDEEFAFPLTIPELALLRIEIHEYDMSEKDDFGGQTCLPVWELRSGIRSVPLYDHRGDRYKSVKLLMHFSFI